MYIVVIKDSFKIYQGEIIAMYHDIRKDSFKIYQGEIIAMYHDIRKGIGLVWDESLVIEGSAVLLRRKGL